MPSCGFWGRLGRTARQASISGMLRMSRGIARGLGTRKTRFLLLVALQGSQEGLPEASYFLLADPPCPWNTSGFLAAPNNRSLRCAVAAGL